jgi:spermidine/putrescine transport system ATP-binding protein
VTDSRIKLVNITKSFSEEGNFAVADISLIVRESEFLTILGPSGCGKTTTLRMIAGFEKPTGGKIFIDGEDVSNTPSYERNVNTVFQNYALFPHMNIYDNIAFGLTMKKVAKDQIDIRVNELLKMIKLEGYEKRMPDQLSGGQKQRVAIARAIINNPKVLLLDEPLGALDLKLRKEMQVELKHLQKQLGISFVYVTHDQEEALTMSDRIVIMNEGHIEQEGTPEEIYERPKSKFVADFIGETNLFEGSVAEISDNMANIQIQNDETIQIKSEDLDISDKVYIAIRPENLKLKNTPDINDLWIKAKLKERIYKGSLIRTLLLTNAGTEIIVNESSQEVFQFSNELTYVTWKNSSAVVMKS